MPNELIMIYVSGAAAILFLGFLIAWYIWGGKKQSDGSGAALPEPIVGDDDEPTLVMGEVDLPEAVPAAVPVAAAVVAPPKVAPKKPGKKESKVANKKKAQNKQVQPPAPEPAPAAPAISAAADPAKAVRTGRGWKLATLILTVLIIAGVAVVATAPNLFGGSKPSDRPVVYEKLPPQQLEARCKARLNEMCKVCTIKGQMDWAEVTTKNGAIGYQMTGVWCDCGDQDANCLPKCNKIEEEGNSIRASDCACVAPSKVQKE